MDVNLFSLVLALVRVHASRVVVLPAVLLSLLLVDVRSNVVVFLLFPILPTFKSYLRLCVYVEPTVITAQH
jgi:hypothetical protein